MKKVIALTSTIILTVFFTLSFFPETAFAADAVIDTSGTYDISTFDDGATVTINGGLSVTLTNTTNITLKDIYIVCAGANTHIYANDVAVYALSGNALKFNGAGNTLTLVGSSYFKTLTGGGGIIVNEGTELTIDGEGYLEAYGTSGYAGIGGEEDTNCGTITILSGTIDAGSKSDAAAIGGGENGSGGNITISGGSIEAKGNTTGAGIGGGKYGSGGNITIEGGYVTTRTGGNSDEAGCASIGGGYGAGGGTITITGGTIDARASEGYDCGAAIGSGSDSTAGSVISISGGNITATGRDSAGIGGGYNSAAGTINIFGDAEVTATGGSGAAGIGGGRLYDGGEINIYGNAKVTATGGSYAAAIGGGSSGAGGTIKIYGYAEVNATGGSFGAGIGGGNSGTGGDITISGGTVTATGGDYINTLPPPQASGGAGIGGGSYADGGNIKISGGTVTAKGGRSAAGIGGGRNGSGGTITISGGTIEASGDYYSNAGVLYSGAGIGGGDNGSGGTITISGGTVTATGPEYSAGIGGGRIGSGGSVSIEGGTVFAAGNQGMDIGHGFGNTDEGTLSISGSSIVFFKHDSFPTPTTSLNYLSMTSVDANGKLCGIALPAGWNEASGYLYDLIIVYYDANGGSGSVPENEICLSSNNYSFTADNGNDLTLSGHYLLKWNTVREGTGIDCLRGVTYSVNSSITLYAQWSKYVSGITLDKHSITINKGDSSKITATVSPSDAYSSVYWSSSDTQVAVVDQNGLVTGTGAGTATITAASYGVSDSCTVTVSEKPVTSVSLNYNKKYMNVGDYLALTAIILPDDATDAKVTWDSSDYTVAQVNSSGVVTALGVGKCTITATSGGKTASCTVGVSREKVSVESVSLSMGDDAMIVMYVGDTMMLSANVSPSNADDASVTWQSSNSAVAEVTGYGKVTAAAEGETTIMVSAGEKTDSYRVTVKAIEGTGGEDKEQSPEIAEPTPSQAVPTPTVEVIYTVQVDTTSLPYGAQYIKLPNGEIVELNGEDKISCEISGSELENGVIKIVALDGEQNSLGTVDVAAKEGGMSGIVIALIVLGAIVLGAGGTLIAIRVIVSKKS